MSCQEWLLYFYSTYSSLLNKLVTCPCGRSSYPTTADVVLSQQFRDSDEPTISNYELDGNTVVIHIDAVSSATRNRA